MNSSARRAGGGLMMLRAGAASGKSQRPGEGFF
ncbi:hypothetical protein M622_05290 [Thauera terpenica 58Eu]|uniref:Uncharacterized protein n=1 Tax=Thauera terpenica 58Eu TaxID=1348657 RepID=T0AWB4_9RHOO|nr:hypothetical protein M622_05290 [Thauera terpenica 58Eu]